jgi:cytochrome b6-f complex iron-sulfur subunit
MAENAPSSVEKPMGVPAAAAPAKDRPGVAAPTPGVPKKVAPGEPKTARPRPPGATRRNFVWCSVFGFLAACGAATVRFFFPRALFEPKTRFVIGYPSDFGIGVSTRFQASQRIWIVRDSSRVFVILARCTHLGCTPDWKEAENKFKCPCHGSGFDAEGVNFEGPAPKPLARVHVELDGEGRIVVDKSKLYEADQWDADGAYLLA